MECLHENAKNGSSRNVAGTLGPIATGVAMRWVGNSSVAAVLWVIAVGFCVVLVRSEGRGRGAGMPMM